MIEVAIDYRRPSVPCNSSDIFIPSPNPREWIIVMIEHCREPENY